MIEYIFNIIAKSLDKISAVTGYSYNEINILVYYFFMPFTWFLLLDLIFQFHVFKIIFVVFCFGFYVGCMDFKKYSDNLFHKSAIFLNYFNRFGSNYIASSVWICVIAPLLIYVLLILILVYK